MGGSPSLRIQLLGCLALSWKGRPLPPILSAAARSLLAYLVIHRDRAHPRALLAGTFWPDRPDTAARKALSNALWQIRQALGPAADRLAVEGDAVAFALHPGDWLDVDVLDRQLRRCWERPAGTALQPEEVAELEAAAALYQGDLVEECYDDWALLEREHLREGYLGLMEQLIAYHKQWGNYERALGLAQRLIAADPLREAAYGEIMRLYYLLGRHRAALSQYEALRQALQDLGAEPAAANTALRDQIAAAMREPGAPHLPAAALPPLLRDPGQMPFVGRAVERTVLLEALQRAGQGQGGVALVSGPAGVGKTRLIQQVVADARWRGWQIGEAKADPLATASPYQLLREALQPLLTPLRLVQLSRLVELIWLSACASLWPDIATHLPDLPPLASLEPPQAQQRLWEGLVQCLAGLGTIAPLLLVLDDVQWADRATLAALAYLGPRLPSQRTLLLLSCRAAEARERPGVWSALDALDRAQPLRRVELAPLAPEETTSLILQALGVTAADQPAAAFAQAVQQRTAGNALFAVELLRSLLEQGALAPQPEGRWAFPAVTDPLPAPPSLGELVGQWLQRLPSAQRSALELAAVLGEDAEFAALDAASSAKPAELTTALDWLRKKGFLAETATGYRFAHDLVRETTYQAIPPQRRRALHRQALQVLEPMAGARVEALAHHAAGGGEWEQAARHYQAAGERAAALGANASAAAAYGQALAALGRLEPADPAQRFDLLLAREQVNGLEGARAEQRQDLLQLKALLERWAGATPGRRAVVALQWARYYVEISDYPAAIGAAQDVLAWATPEQDPALAVKGLLAWGRGLWRQGDYAQARERYAQALAIARASGDLDGEADGLLNLGNVFLYQGSYEQAQSHYEQSLSLYERLGRRKDEGNAQNNLGLTTDYQGDYARARNYYEQALRIYREIGFRRGQGHALNNLGTILKGQGDFVQARDCFEQSWLIFQQIGDREGVGSALANVGTCYEDYGDHAQARTYYQQSLEHHQKLGYRRGEGATLAYLARLSHLLGDSQAALDYARRALDMAEEMGERVLQGYSFLYQGYALLDLGHLSPAAAAFQQALHIRRELGDPAQYLEPLAALARVALSQGDNLQAHRYAEDILGYLARESFSHADNLLLVYLSCYHALQANQDPRSPDILARAYTMLQERAAMIGDPEVRRCFLEAIPTHHEIVTHYEAMALQSHGRPVPLHLPRADAPTGRPLHDDEYVTVAWTIESPADREISSKVARRQHRLRRLLREVGEQGAAPTVDDLAAALQVSPATIKRDLKALRRAGEPVQTRGAADSK